MTPANGTFTRIYQRANKHYGAVLYGAVLGFVVYVWTLLAGRSGFAGQLWSAFATTVSAFAAICFGSVVPLHKEDGRA